jgi:signal transduction histidine kinase
VVVAHGGRIDIQSTVDAGTTFQVRLPTDLPGRHEIE